MRWLHPFLAVLAGLLSHAMASAQPLTAAGQPAQLDVRVAGASSIRVTLKPVGFKDNYPYSPALAERSYPAAELSLREIVTPVKTKIGNFEVEVRPHPLTLLVKNAAGERVQELVFDNDGNLSFRLSDQPVLGMGEGGPRPERGKPWREQPIQF